MDLISSVEIEEVQSQLYVSDVLRKQSDSFGVVRFSVLFSGFAFSRLSHIFQKRINNDEIRLYFIDLILR